MIEWIDTNDRLPPVGEWVMIYSPTLLGNNLRWGRYLHTISDGRHIFATRNGLRPATHWHYQDYDVPTRNRSRGLECFECDRPVTALGLCSKHYQREYWRKRREAEAGSDG